MALSNISFIKGQGGLGRTLPGQDYVSGIIFYNNTKPVGFTSGNTYTVELTSIVDAETAGITSTYADEIQARATVTIVSSGTTGDTVDFTVTDSVNGQTVDLGTYTSAGSLSTSTEASAVISFINTQTYSTGYYALSGTLSNQVVIVAPKGLGVSLNGGNLSLTAVGSTLSATTTGFTGGVASVLSQYHYQISEYFRLQPNGILWCYIANVPTAYFATELATIQTQANGAIRQLAILANAKTAVAKGDVDAIQAAVTSTEAIFGVSMSVLYSCDITATTNLTSLVDMSSWLDNKVSVIISQSFSGEGFRLWKETAKSIPTLGACLGNVSLAKVSDDIAWVGQYNVSDGTEDEIVGFANGQLITAISNSLLEQLNGYRYIYLRKFIGVSGSYWNDSNCSISTSSDYAYIENNRTIDKAIRNVRTFLIPELNSPITLNSDGTIAALTIAHLTGLANQALEALNRNQELSAYSVTIPSNQNVLATSTIKVVLSIVPKGVARQIVVTIGFTASI